MEDLQQPIGIHLQRLRTNITFALKKNWVTHQMLIPVARGEDLIHITLLSHYAKLINTSSALSFCFLHFLH